MQLKITDRNGFRADYSDRLAEWLLEQASQRPFERGEAIVVDAESDAERLRTVDLGERLRSSGLGVVARKLERRLVPPGHTLVLVLGDDVQIKVVETADLAQRSPTPPGPVDGLIVPGEPWRRAKWVAPIPLGLRRRAW